MILALTIIFRVIVAILALLTVWDIVREKSLAYALCLGMISIPLIMRAFMIK